jgi:hypothetical protein
LAGDFKWIQIVSCLSGGGGVGADCAGYPYNGFRYDTPTWAGFSVSTGYYEDDVWDVAVKYAADWNSIKVSAAAGYTQLTDEGCSGVGNANCGGVAGGGGGTPFQAYRRDAQLFQVGASVMHVPSGLFAYGLWQREENDGTQWQGLAIENNIRSIGFVNNTNFAQFRKTGLDVNENDVYYIKAGIKRAWMPAGATVLFGEWGQYNDQFAGLCGNPGGNGLVGGNAGNTFCAFNLPTGVVNVKGSTADGAVITTPALITGSEVNRWGLGVVQEIDSAAMHVFARWQRLEGTVSAQNNQFCSLGSQGGAGAGSAAQCGTYRTFDVNLVGGEVPGDDFVGFTPDGKVNKKFGKKLNSSFEDLDIFQIGGVIFF